MNNPPSWSSRMTLNRVTTYLAACLTALAMSSDTLAAENREGVVFFEKHIRPLLANKCFECHSEAAGEQQGGLLLDRKTAWIKGGDTGKAVVPGDPDESLLIQAVRYEDDNLQMPPEQKLTETEIRLLEQWVSLGAPGPAKDLGETEFSRLGDQEYLFEQAKQHWAFQPITKPLPPQVNRPGWDTNPIDRFVLQKLESKQLSPSPRADARTLLRRLHYDLTGLPPTKQEMQAFDAAYQESPRQAIVQTIDRLLASQRFGEHLARMWLDVARYADTDSFYRPDTKTPHYFPFAFTYRDYVIDAFNADKPVDEFIKEQLAADLMNFDANANELAALGFLAVGPHANRSQAESLDDWIDVTTRGLLGLTVSCARCHDHKYEPIPTADYYALRGVFESTARLHPLDEDRLPELTSYNIAGEAKADYLKQREIIDRKIEKAGSKKTKNNDRSLATTIRETELAELLLFHPGAPARAMVVQEKGKPVAPYIFLRGDRQNRGESVPRRFLTILDQQAKPFPKNSSGRLELAEAIVDERNPLTARVFVNRVWGLLMGKPLVATASDFGLQGSAPSHPKLLDWLASDFIEHGWSVKHLVRQITTSSTYLQASRNRPEMSNFDPNNSTFWRGNRKRLSIEAIRDSMLAVSGQLDTAMHGHPSPLWGTDYSKRRSIYGYINRFNLDPTLRVFDFPTPMQTHPTRGESVVAPQSLFTMNAPFVIDQSITITQRHEFQQCRNDEERISSLFQTLYQREPHGVEVRRIQIFVKQQSRFFPQPKSPIKSAWPLVAQALLMSNEFQYLD